MRPVSDDVIHVDLGSPDADGRLLEACRQRGMLVVDLPAGLPVDPAGLAGAVDALFSQDDAARLALSCPTGHPHRGWRRFYDETGRATYERLSIGRYDSADDARRAGVDPAHAGFYAHENTWPAVPGFRPRFEAFRTAMSGLCVDLLNRLPAGLGAHLTPAELATDNASCAVSRYYGREGDTTLLFRDHVDLSFLTAVWQAGGRPGLEIERDDGTWVEVAASPRQVIVLCGDMLRRRSGGATRNGRHRVAAPRGGDRDTVLCLYAPSLATELEAAAGGHPAVTIWDLVHGSAERYMQQAATPGEVAAWREGRPYVPEPSQTGAWRHQPATRAVPGAPGRGGS